MSELSGRAKEPVAAFVHMLGKDARRRIIEVLVSGRSVREAAELLGVTPAAVSKYLSGRTHPSDEVLARALRAAGGGELREMVDVIVDEFLDGVDSLVQWLVDQGVPDRRLARGLEEAAARLRLASAHRNRIIL